MARPELPALPAVPTGPEVPSSCNGSGGDSTGAPQALSPHSRCVQKMVTSRGASEQRAINQIDRARLTIDGCLLAATTLIGSSQYASWTPSSSGAAAPSAAAPDSASGSTGFSEI